MLLIIAGDQFEAFTCFWSIEFRVQYLYSVGRQFSSTRVNKARPLNTIWVVFFLIYADYVYLQKLFVLI